MRFIIIIYCLVFLISCASKSHLNYSAYKKYSPEALQNDFDILQKVLEREHPSLYWHSSKTQMDSVFNYNRALLKDSMTEFQFKQKVANVLANIKCGHTSVRNTPQFEKWLNTANLSYFPIGMRLFADSLVSTYNLYRKDTLIPRGSIIKSINGKATKDIIAKMFDIMSTDGSGDNFKNIRISNNFPFYYFSAFDSAKNYTVVYDDSVGVEKSISFGHFKRPPPDTTKRKRDTTKKIVIQQAPPKLTKEQKRERVRKLTIDTTNSTALITLTSFSGGKQKRFYKKTFKTLQTQKIQNLIIDVRNNGGGLIGNSVALSRYLAKTPFKVADSVYAIHRFSKFNKHIRFRFWYGVSTLLLTKKKSDGNYHFNFLNKRTAKPKRTNHFDGNTYIITGGYSFSATTLFINYIAHQPNIITVGEATGGSAYGNTAVYIPNLKLPNTKLKVRMPMFRLVMNKNEILGKPFIPKVYVGPTLQTIKKGNDNKMEKVLELIKLSSK